MVSDLEAHRAVNMLNRCPKCGGQGVPCVDVQTDGLYQHVRAAFEAVQRERINPHAFRRAAAPQRFLSGLSWAQIGRELGWGENEAETMGAIYVPDEALEDAG